VTRLAPRFSGDGDDGEVFVCEACGGSGVEQVEPRDLDLGPDPAETVPALLAVIDARVAARREGRPEPELPARIGRPAPAVPRPVRGRRASLRSVAGRRLGAVTRTAGYPCGVCGGTGIGETPAEAEARAAQVVAVLADMHRRKAEADWALEEGGIALDGDGYRDNCNGR